jgi:hypothetical protein
MTKSFCRENCGYFQSSKSGGYGCDRFDIAQRCPVAFIQGVIASPYEIAIPEGLAPVVEGCAKACCPDPSVRLAALRAWPLEELDVLRRRAELSDRPEPKALVQRLDELISNPIQIGAKHDSDH